MWSAVAAPLLTLWSNSQAAAKKSFDESMKKTSATFAKMYAPAKGATKDILDSPLGADGQSGISSMAKWSYSHQVATYSAIAHKKVTRKTKQLVTTVEI